MESGEHNSLPYGPELEAALERAMKERVPLARPPAGYTGAILLVLAVMLLLPLVYFGFVGATAYAIFLYAERGPELLKHLRGAGFITLYICPLLAGAGFLYFLVRPLWLARSSGGKQFLVDRKREPILYAFVEKLADVLGAPVPQKIFLVHEANAYACRPRLFGSEFHLTIGMPLAAGLSLEQLAGVIAHELGHFRQSIADKMLGGINTINRWLGLLVHYRDSSDEELERYSSTKGDGRIIVVAAAIRIFNWIARKVISVFWLAGEAVSAGMLRRQEFDADRYEAVLVGSETFASTTHLLSRLSAAQREAIRATIEGWQRGVRCDNFTGLVLRYFASVRPEGSAKAEKNDDRVSWFSSHPHPEERIRAVMGLAESGIFHFPGPASQLFREFSSLCIELTEFTFRDTAGAVSGEELVNAGKIQQLAERTQEEFSSLARVFQGRVNCYRMFTTDEKESFREVSNLADLKYELDAAGGELAEARDDYCRLLSEFAADTLEAVNLEAAAQASRVVETQQSRIELLEQSGLLKKALKQADYNLKALERPARRYVHAILAALSSGDEQFEPLKKEVSLNELRDSLILLRELRLLEPLVFQVRTARMKVIAFARMFESAAEPGPRAKLAEMQKAALHDMRESTEIVFARSGELSNPFAEGEAVRCLRDLLFREGIEADSAKLYTAAERMFTEFYACYFRICAKIAATGERCEKAVGLQALPVPPDELSELIYNGAW